MKFDPDTVKGFQDFLPPESLRRKKIKGIIEKYFAIYGFLPVETPMIEFDELMRSESLLGEEDQAVSDRFRLKDRAGRNLGLRYEFTFQLARILKQNPTIKMPFRRYQIGPVFRDEPVSSNRFRQFTQCDADIVGSKDMNSDAECLSLISDILKEIGIEAEIQVNSRELLSSLIESAQIENKEGVMRELDKLDKVGEDVVRVNLKKYTSGNQVLTLFKLLEKDLAFFKENAFDGAEEISELIDKCKAYGVNVKFNALMMRGLSYYTGNIFEVISPGGRGTIAAGGRYDDLVGKFLDRQIPSVGISFGLERISQLAKVKLEGEGPRVLLISIEEDEESIGLIKKLRKSGVASVLASGNPSKQLEFANSQRIPWVVFIGEEEVSEGKFKLRNMESGAEELLTGDEILEKLKKS
jgi:histidyl-tRNA synthetase